MGIYITLANKIEEFIQTKNIKYELKNEQSIKYLLFDKSFWTIYL